MLLFRSAASQYTPGYLAQATNGSNYSSHSMLDILRPRFNNLNAFLFTTESPGGKTMKRYWLAISGLCSAMLLFALPLLAHHSFAAEYDNNKPIKFSGKVTKVEWMNPHIYVYVDAKDDSGKMVNYAVEGGAPNGLYRQGWRKDTLKTGDPISIEGFLAKDGSNTVNARTWVLPDGKKVFAGNNEDGGPAAKP
jgi:Family of unknown function (DUF6152)